MDWLDLYKESLPQDYNENVLNLMVQSPHVLYAYWEMSRGLKELLKEKQQVQIRLIMQGGSCCHHSDIDMVGKSYYFQNVKPGCIYYCEIGVINTDGQFYALLRSDMAVAPHDRPLEGKNNTNEQLSSHSLHGNMSSWSGDDSKQ